MTLQPIPFVKGHGTGNDFIILSNLDAALVVTPALVAALCDRRRGIGGDGVLVVCRSADHPEVAAQADGAPYFMDYRNADGSVAEMCGNGARVFVAHLVAQGLAVSGRFQIATRGGARSVRVEDGFESIAVDMGVPAFLARADIEVLAADTMVARIPAVGVLMPNPHAVAWVPDLADAGRLLEAPSVLPEEAYPDGANVEFVRVVNEEHIQMRVFERGVGETLSCGTGACAAVVATLRRAGHPPAGQRVRVDVPGGTVVVTWHPDSRVELQGPAVLVAAGTIDQQWWESHV
jgi:diaminopimelate epimerase